mgnify:CR=1 FL=1|tara:strand:- start:2007 stop:2837 length:831 start_codon:yes stop_codon:yes gene_type:complete
MISFDSAKADIFFNLITDNGYYLDIGVRDGIHDNKTFLLYKNGWKGISVDAHPDYTDICKITRPNDTVINIICGKDDDNCKFRYNWRGSFSSIYIKELDESRTKQVNPKWYGNLNDDTNDFLGFKNSIEHSKSSSLNTIIDEYNTDNKIINLLSIDVDGSEKELLQNFDIKKYNPEFVCIELEEHSSSLTEDNKFIIDYMKNNNYILLAKFSEDYIWCNNNENFTKGKTLINKFKNNGSNIKSIPTIHPCTYFYENNLKLSKENIIKYKEYIYSLF